jgi:CRISPR-associated protein Csb2
MLAIVVDLLHGTLTTGSPDDVALTGRADTGEWPPSPARLLSALVAADGTRERCKVTDGSELGVLEAAPPPVILADPRNDVAVNAQLGRFVPVDQRDKGAVQEYVARKSTLVRPSPTLSPRVPKVAYVWPDLEVGDDCFTALRRRAARIGYLGGSRSPVRVRVRRDDAEALLDDRPRRWQPAADGSIALPVPFDGMVDVLDQMFDDFSSGKVPRRSWYRAERHGYHEPASVSGPHRAPPHVIWLRTEHSLPGRYALLLTKALRGLTLSAYERLVTGDRDGVPQILHGHGFEGSGYDHVSWLALPDVGHQHATGRLHGAAVMLPADAAPEVVEGVRTAMWGVHTLRIARDVEIDIRPHKGELRPWAAHPRRWTGRERRWVSALPVVHERWSKKPPALDDVARWCRHAGLPAPVTARLSEPPLVPGAVALMPHETRRDGQPMRPYSHAEIAFAEPVDGPVVLGRLRHFGLGLMLPMSSRGER